MLGHASPLSGTLVSSGVEEATKLIANFFKNFTIAADSSLYTDTPESVNAIAFNLGRILFSLSRNKLVVQ